MASPEVEKTPELLIGAQATVVVKTILEQNPEIEFLTLRIHPLRGDPKKYWEQEDEVQKIPISREQILYHYGLEDWIYYLGVITEHEIDWLFLQERLSISSGSLLVGEKPESTMEDWPLARYLSIESRVKTPEPAQILMLDFDCRKTFGNLTEVVDTLRCQGQKGYVLESNKYSDKGFHFWGSTPISEKDWREFIERNKKNPLLDQTFIKISEKLGFSCLRITRSMDEEEREAPRILATL